MSAGQRMTLAELFYHARRFVLFLLVIALFVQSSVLILLNAMRIDEQVIRRNAPQALLNILLLGMVFFVLDSLRRRYTVDRHVRRIIQGLQQIQAGDFSVRIAPIDRNVRVNELDQVIDGINRMTMELAGVETLRTDFLSNVSHELKTPLAVMGNYAALLQNRAITQEQRTEYARAISDAAQRLSSLIANILRLNKLENQQIYPACAPFNLSEQLCECILGFEQLWEEKGLELQTDIAEEVFVCADGELLSLVWNNLLSNAVKFTQPGGTISCSLKTEGAQAVVTVSDTGCGMSAETGARIFEKFYQGDTSHAAQGNGLGLSLVKKVIDILGGEISVKSILGKGSTFTVRLGRQET